APVEKRQQRDETGDRAGDADVEERLLRWERLADADDRAERSGERQRRGNEVGQRGIDAVIAAREIVSELVRAQNRQQRQRVPQAVEKDGPREADERADLPLARRPVRIEDERRQQE